MAEPSVPAGSAARIARPEGGAIIKPDDPFFSGLSDPFYSVTVTVDVTALHTHTKRRGLSFYYALPVLCIVLIFRFKKCTLHCVWLPRNTCRN